METLPKKYGWKPWFWLIGLPFLFELTENLLDHWKGDGNGVIEEIDTPLTAYQVISVMIALLFGAKLLADRNRKFWSRFVFSIAGIALLLLLAEGVARIVYRFSNRALSTVEGYRLSQPAPYRNAPYFSEEFVKESTLKLRWETPPATTLLLPVDFEGKYIHVRNKLRVTTDQPANSVKRILVFGGSTIFCNEVSDSFTVCSYLQRKLNADYPGRYAVYNYGVTSVNTSQELERLKTITLDSNDIVLMYDGVNDVFNTIYQDDPAGTIFSAQKKAYDSNPVFKFFYDMKARFLGHSRLVELLFNPYAKEEPEYLSDVQEMKKMSDFLYQHYLSNVMAARRYCSQSNAAFHHFLQPDLYVKQELTPYENQMLRYFEYPGLRKAFGYGRPQLVRANDEMAQTDSSSTDLSHIFDHTLNDVYLDFCHVAHEGNSLVADEMFKTIVQQQMLK